MAKAQISSNAQLNQLAQIATQQSKTNELVAAQIGSITETMSQLAQFAMQQSKTNEVFATDLKELKSQLGKVIELVNEREHGKFPSDTIKPRHEQVRAISLRSGEKLQENIEVEKVPEQFTSVRTGEHERSYKKESDTEAKTSAREVNYERSCEENNPGLDT